MTRVMPDTPVQTAAAVPVLNYDPLTRSYKASRLWWRILFFLVCGAAGAIAGLVASPAQFRAVAYVKIPPQTQQPAAVAALRSPAAITAGVNSARINGVTFTPAQVSSKLKVRAVPKTELIEIAGLHDTPEVAAAIAGGVANYYVASNPSALIIGGPAIPATQQLQPVFILGGLIAGLAGAWMVVTLWKR